MNEINPTTRRPDDRDRLRAAPGEPPNAADRDTAAAYWAEVEKYLAAERGRKAA